MIYEEWEIRKNWPDFHKWKKLPDWLEIFSGIGFS